MAAEGEVSVNIKINSDTAGGAEAKKSVESVGEAAKSASNDATSSAGVFKGALSGISSAAKTCSTAIRGISRALGMIGFAMHAVQLLVEAFQKLKDWINRNEIAAAKLAEEIRKQKYAESVAAANREYEKLNKSVAENLRMEKEKNSLLDARKSQERSLEDEKLNLAEAQELDAVDPNDPDASSKRELISIKYGRKRSELAAKRADEDTRTEVKRLSAEEEQKRAEAEGYRKQMQGAAGKNVDTKRKEYYETKAAAERGDKKAAEKLPEIERQLDEAIAAYKKLKEAAEAAEKEADILHERMLVASNGDRAAYVRNQATQQQLNTQERDTRSGMQRDQQERKNREEEQRRKEQEKKDKEAADREKSRSELSDAQRARDILTQQKAQIESQIQLQQKKKDAANYSVYQAQGTMDAARIGGNRRDQQSALGNLQSAQNAAQNVNHAADTAINALVKALADIEAKLKQAERVIEKHSKQQNSFMSESPAGA